MRTSLHIGKYKTALVWVLIALLTLISGIIGFTIKPKAETSSVNDKLIMQLGMDETFSALDSSGNEIDSAIISYINPVVAVGGVQNNSATMFAENTNFATVTKTGGFNMSAQSTGASVSMWVKDLSKGEGTDWSALFSIEDNINPGMRITRANLQPISIEGEWQANAYPGSGTSSLHNGFIFTHILTSSVDKFAHVVVNFSVSDGIVFYVDGMKMVTYPANSAVTEGIFTTTAGELAERVVTILKSSNTTKFKILGDGARSANEVVDDVRLYNGALTELEIAELYGESSAVIAKTLDADDNVAGLQTISTAKAGYLATENFGKILMRTADEFPILLINGGEVANVTTSENAVSGITADGATYSYTKPTAIEDSNSVVVTITKGTHKNAFTVVVNKAKNTYLTELKIAYLASGKVESNLLSGFMPNIYNYDVSLPALAQNLAFETKAVGDDTKVNVTVSPTISETNFENTYTLTVSEIGEGADPGLDVVYTVVVTRDSSAAINGITYNGININGFDTQVTDGTVQNLITREPITAEDVGKFAIVQKYDSNVTSFDVPTYDTQTEVFTLVVRDKISTANIVTYKFKYTLDTAAGSAGIDDKLIAKFNLDSTFKAENKAGAIADANVAYSGSNTFVNGVEGTGGLNFANNKSFATVTKTGGYGITNSDGATFSMWVKDLNKGATNDWGALLAIYDGTNAGVRLTRGNVQAITKDGGFQANIWPSAGGGMLNSKPTSYILDSSNSKFAHVVVSFSVTNGIYFYVNGEAMSFYRPDSKLAESTISITDLCNRVITILKGNKNVKIEILGTAADSERTANEVVDDFRIYSGALSLAEIQALKEESDATQFSALKIGDADAFAFTIDNINSGLPYTRADFTSTYILTNTEPEVVITAVNGNLVKILKGEKEGLITSDIGETYYRHYTIKNGLSYRIVKISFTASDESSAKTLLSDIKVGGATIEGFIPSEFSYNYSLDALTAVLPTITYSALNANEVTITCTSEADYDCSSEFVFNINIFMKTNQTDTPNRVYKIIFAKKSAAVISGLSIGTSTLDTFNASKVSGQIFYVNKLPTLTQLAVALKYHLGAIVVTEQSNIDAEGNATIYVKDTINKDSSDLSLDKTYTFKFKVAGKANSTFHFSQQNYSAENKTFASLDSSAYEANHNDTTSSGKVSAHEVNVNSGYSTFGSLGQITIPKAAINNTNTDGFSYSVWYKRDSGTMGEYNVLASLAAGKSNFNTSSVIGFTSWTDGFANDKKNNFTALVTSQWKLVTTVLSGNTAYYYVDGLLAHKTSQDLIAKLITSDGTSKLTTLTLGSTILYDNANDHTAGDYRAFYFHDAPLSSDAILAMYSQMKNSDIASLSHTSGDTTTMVEGFAGSIYSYDIGFTYSGVVGFELFPVISETNFNLNGNKDDYQIAVEIQVVNANGATDTERYVNNKIVTYIISIKGNDDSIFDKTYTIKFKACNINTALSSIKVNGRDVENVSGNTDSYIWNIPEGTISDVVVTASAEDGAALAQITYRNDAKKYLIITVTSEFGLMQIDSANYSKAYRLNFVEKSVNANLVGITIAGKAVDGFNKRVSEYFNIPVINIPSATDIVAQSENSAANVSVTLAEDGLSAIVKCNAEYELSQKEYKLNFILASDNTTLSTVMFGDYAYMIKGDGNEFSVNLKDVNLTDLEIVANTVDGGATVFVEKKLSANKVIITVTSEYGTTKTYTFNLSAKDKGCSSNINAIPSFFAGGGAVLIIFALLTIKRKNRTKREDA